MIENEQLIGILPKRDEFEPIDFSDLANTGLHSSDATVIIGIKLFVTLENSDFSICEAINEIAKKCGVCFMRKFGDIWIGSIGYFDTTKTTSEQLEYNNFCAILFCCEVAAVVENYRGPLLFAIDCGKVIGGIFSGQNFEMFLEGSIKWISTHLEIPLDKMHYYSRIVINTQVKQLLGRFVRSETASVKLKQIAARIFLDEFKRTKAPTLNLYGFDETQVFVICNASEISQLTTNDIKFYIKMIKEAKTIEWEYDLDNILWDKYSWDLTDEQFLEKINYPLKRVSKLEDTIGENHKGGPYPHHNGYASKHEDDPLLYDKIKGYIFSHGTEILDCFLTTTLETTGISLLDPIMDEYTDEEWEEMHENFGENLDKSIFKHCYNDSWFNFLFSNSDSNFKTMGLYNLADIARTGDQPNTKTNNENMTAKQAPHIAQGNSNSSKTNTKVSVDKETEVKKSPLKSPSTVIDFYINLFWVFFSVYIYPISSNQGETKKTKLALETHFNIYHDGDDREEKEKPLGFDRKTADYLQTNHNISSSNQSSSMSGRKEIVGNNLTNNDENDTGHINIDDDIILDEKAKSAEVLLSKNYREGFMRMSINYYRGGLLFFLCHLPAMIMFSKYQEIPFNEGFDQLGKSELYMACYFGHIFSQVILQRKYSTFIVAVCMACRTVLLLKFYLNPVVETSNNQFILGANYYHDTSHSTVVLFVIFFTTWPIQMLMQTKILFLDLIYTIAIQQFRAAAFPNFPLLPPSARSVMVSFLTIKFLYVRCAQMISFRAYVIESKIMPYAQLSFRQYRNQAKSAIRAYIPDNLSGNRILAHASSHICIKRCTVIAIHIKQMEVFYKYSANAQIFIEKISEVTAIIDKCLAECGLIKTSQLSGYVIAIACDDAVWDSPSSNNKNAGKLPINYHSRTLYFIRNLEMKMNRYMNQVQHSLSWSVGLDHGSAMVGLLGDRNKTFDIIGKTRDTAMSMAGAIDHRNEGGVYASEAFKQVALETTNGFNVSLEEIQSASGKIQVYRIQLTFNGISLADLEHIRMIGAGSFGTVHLVNVKSTNAQYAIKVVDTSNANASVTEFMILQEMTHKNVIDCKYSITSNEYMYIIMTCLQGGNLQQLISTEKLTIPDLTQLFAELILALEYVHFKGYIHCDVKPANCMLGLDGHLRLSDFGLSKKIENSTHDTAHYEATFSKTRRGSSSSIFSKIFPLKALSKSVHNVLIVTTTENSEVQNKLNSTNYSCNVVTNLIDLQDSLQFLDSIDLFLIEISQEDVRNEMELLQHDNVEMSKLVAVLSSSSTSIDGKNEEQNKSYYKENNLGFCSEAIKLISEKNINVVVLCPEVPQSNKGEIEDVLRTKYQEYTVRAFIFPFLEDAANASLLAKLAREGREKNLKQQNQSNVDFSDSTIPNGSFVETPDGSHSASSSVRTGAFTSFNTANVQKQNSRKVGTLQYIAPEVLNSSSYSSMVDWWAAGVTFYECVTRKRLFSGTQNSIIRKISYQPIDLDILTLKTREHAIIWKDLDHAHKRCLVLQPSKNTTNTTKNNNMADHDDNEDCSEVSRIELLVQAMLNRNPEARLGSGTGHESKDMRIKDNLFFSHLNWSSINDSDPVFKPPVHNLFNDTITQGDSCSPAELESNKLLKRFHKSFGEDVTAKDIFYGFQD